MTALNLKKF